MKPAVEATVLSSCSPKQGPHPLGPARASSQLYSSQSFPTCLRQHNGGARVGRRHVRHWCLKLSWQPGKAWALAASSRPHHSSVPTDVRTVCAMMLGGRAVGKGKAEDTLELWSNLLLIRHSFIQSVSHSTKTYQAPTTCQACANVSSVTLLPGAGHPCH